jgi:hypothetical protein
MTVLRGPMIMQSVFPRLYPIVDKATLDAKGIRLACFARELARAGVGVVQYRDKLGCSGGHCGGVCGHRVSADLE